MSIEGVRRVQEGKAVVQLKASSETRIQSPSLLQIPSAILRIQAKLLTSTLKMQSAHPGQGTWACLSKVLNTQSISGSSSTVNMLPASLLFFEKSGLCYLK